MTADEVRILEQLKRATERLLFMSESDYPFETFYWEGVEDLSYEHLRSVSGQAEDSSVEEMEIGDFLQLEQYRNVVRVFSENLTEVKAYRVGERNMPVYVIGRSKAGNWLGVSTRVVWT